MNYHAMKTIANRLTLVQREIVTRYYLDGQSDNQIAGIMSNNKKTAEQLETEPAHYTHQAINEHRHKAIKLIGFEPRKYWKI